MNPFRRARDFRPDRTGGNFLQKLYITPKQRTAIFRWLLCALVLTVLCVVQDVIFSRVHIGGYRIDLMAAGLLLLCVLQDPEYGSIFVLIASALYSFSGSAPGYYVIALLTVFGVFFAIVRHCYLYSGFGSTFLCTAAAIGCYELALFAIGLFFGYTTFSRWADFAMKAVLSIAVLPVLYPIFHAILKIGGTQWND